MHLKAITLVLSTTLLFVTSLHAMPGNSVDEIGKPTGDKSFLTQVGQVRQTVSNKASELVGNAMGFLGTAYRRGGSSVETGFDCSGFVRAVYEQSIGLILPRRAEQQAAATENVDKKDLQPGDLVFFNTMRRAFSHVGIYVGDGKFIHSPKPGAQVRVESMSLSYWRGRFDGARRVAGKSVDQSVSSNQPAPFAVLLPASQAFPAAILQGQPTQQDVLFPR